MKLKMKLVTLLVLCTASAICFADVPRIMPALSRQRIDLNFKQANDGFQQRWKEFAQNRTFVRYAPDFKDDELAAKFLEIKKTRKNVYYENFGELPQRSRMEYERSQILLSNGCYKVLHHMAFEYNHTHPSYNSSNVILNGHRFLALEGPQKPEHVGNFLRLLVNYDVKQLVRLTRDEDHGFKSQNYWRDAVNVNKNEQQLLTFKLEGEDPTQTQPYSVLYYATDSWLDFSGTSPELLLQMVEQVRKDYKKGDIVAVHCSAGVGRTGTFIAAFLLLDEVDQQLQRGVPKNRIKLSIEELVYKLSLQRAYAVAEPEQYVNLHQLVKMYVAKV
ncbi:MAG TPA: protein-tyrosine phosphatase family protein [Gammaproteobacteria bacterium]|nr:protein-tyrosine phosphatase family protein [Gammaproteobacteria bacterium]